MPRSQSQNRDGSPAAASLGSPLLRRATVVEGPDSELLDDGQEEVFAYSAVERGLVEDPKALGPEELSRVPQSPGSLASPGG